MTKAVIPANDFGSMPADVRADVMAGMNPSAAWRKKLGMSLATFQANLSPTASQAYALDLEACSYQGGPRSACAAALGIAPSDLGAFTTINNMALTHPNTGMPRRAVNG
jgi:hypothetical protein